jgi:hypothetical protein
VLTVHGYQQTGGIRGAITTTAENIYERLDPVARRAIRHVLLRMVRIGDGTEHTRHTVNVEDLIEESPEPTATRAVIDAFAGARLITLGHSSAGQPTAEITHESLLQAWRRLHDWINADHAGLLTRQKLTDAAEAWDRDGRDPAQLYGGATLANAREWQAAAGPRADLSLCGHVVF